MRRITALFQIKQINRLFEYILFISLSLLISCSKIDDNSPESEIASFKFSTIATQQIAISKEKKSVEITLPYGTSLKSLIPIIEISQGASIVPSSAIPQDFSQPVYYVLTNTGGRKTVYKVSVITLSQPVPEINNVDKKEFEAGESIIVSGRYFGNNPSIIKAYFINNKKEEILITSKLIDTTHIQLSVPNTIPPQAYNIKIVVKDNSIVSDFTVNVQYPTPEITSLSKKNILQGDTLVVKGNFLSDAYTYQLGLNDGKNNSNVPVQITKGIYYVIAPKTIPSGNYPVKIINKTLQKESKSLDFSITLYDINKPFVQEIINPKMYYVPGDKISFKTLNFESFPARFFQIQLLNGNTGLVQNGLYSKATNSLTLDLPSSLKAGTYSITLTLINLANQEYSIDMDDRVVVK